MIHLIHYEWNENWNKIANLLSWPRHRILTPPNAAKDVAKEERAHCWWRYKPVSHYRRHFGSFIKAELTLSLASLAQWSECQPANQGVTSSIPSWSSCLGYGPGPQRGMHERGNHTLIFFSLFFPLLSPLSLKILIKSFKKLNLLKLIKS